MLRLINAVALAWKEHSPNLIHLIKSWDYPLTNKEKTTKITYFNCSIYTQINCLFIYKFSIQYLMLTMYKFNTKVSIFSREKIRS